MYVEWLDHISFNEQNWREKEEYDHLEPATVRTVGWILREDNDKIIIVQNWHYSDEYDDKFSGDICILKGCIKELKELKND